MAICLGLILVIGMLVAASEDYFPSSLRKSLTWILTSIPFLLYMIIEILVWRSKKRWATVAVEDANTQGESDETDGADEENPVEEVNSPLPRHSQQTDDDNDDDHKVIVSVEMTAQQNQTSSSDNNNSATQKQRKPSMVKNPSSRPPVPVSTIVKKIEEKCEQL